ncbi:MAG: type I-C CRISPR-associated protein Cas5c [Prevotella sp.]|jgi:CRISPR-associated protein Cas5d
MEYHDKEYCLEVWGDYACFTRPELKVERVSYDVITPSAARAIFEAIFWKPAIHWQVTRIEVMNPIRWFNIKRNEVGKTMSPKSDGLIIEDNRQQRSSMVLRDVRYRIFARQEFIPVAKRPANQKRLGGDDENPGKYNAMFERRAGKGQCFNQPYLGCREFSCDFRLVEPASYGEGIDETRDLGLMLYDMEFQKGDIYGEKPATALFFRAQMNHGVIIVPPKESEEVLR